MRFLELNLIAFGPFTERRIDLAAGRQGLHLIYGPNEAGKSSSLRAITDFLYGFPTRTSDDFQHPYSNLRIGGRLRHRDGTELNVIRRKANQKSLRCLNDQDHVADQQLANLLGDVDREFFTMMFAIDHQRLRSGGQEIAAGKGRIGEMLFAAGAGLVDLQNLQQGLQADIDGLLKSSGRSGVVHAGIQEYLVARKSVSDRQVTIETWNRHDGELQAAFKRRTSLEEQIGNSCRELDRLTRIHNAVPVIDRWRIRTAAWELLRDAPKLDPDFAEQINPLLISLRTAQTQQSAAEAALRSVEEQLATLAIPIDLLQRSEAIEALRDRIGPYRKSLLDRPVVAAKRELFEQESKDILRDLDQPTELGEIEHFRLSPDKSLRIHELGNKQERLLERLQAERKRCEKIRLEITQAETSQQSFGVTAEFASFRATLRVVQEQGNLDSELANEILELERMQQKSTLAIQQLPLWSGDVRRLESIAVPFPAAVDRIDEQLKFAQHSTQTLRQRLFETGEQRESLQQQLSDLESGQAVPTQDDLVHWRQVRDVGWLLVLSEWQSRTCDSTLREDFAKQFTPPLDLRTAYQHAVAQSDRIADDLRNDAERVALKVKLQSDYERTVRLQAKIQQQLAVAETASRAVEADWLALWKPLGITPLSPAEMQDWLRKHESIVQTAAQISDRKQRIERLKLQIADCSQRLISALQQLTPLTNLQGKSLQELLRLLGDQCEDLQAAVNRQEQLIERLNSNRQDLMEVENQYRETSAEWAQLQADWSAEMKHLGLEKNALPAQANLRLSSINELWEKNRELERFRTRLEHIDRDARLFESEVQRLLEQVAPELIGQPTEQAFQALLSKLQSTRLLSQKQESLIDRQSELLHQKQLASEHIEGTTAILEVRMQQANVTALEQLTSAAQRSLDRRAAEANLMELEGQIASFCAGAKLADFLHDVDTELKLGEPLSHRIEQCNEAIDRLRDERDLVLAAISRAESEMQKFDGISLAAEQNAACESIAARLDEQFQSLAVLKVASAVLATGIEQHRQKNQGPILNRASQIFQQITLGQFSDLHAEYNLQGEPILAGVRRVEGGGRPAKVLVDGMSDGTCDQLYLALRLASLESWLAVHEPVPFIVDDVLLNFDDGRAVATLKVLAEFSQQTQIIFFTHHQHVVNLAQQNLSSQDLFVTVLGSLD